MNANPGTHAAETSAELFTAFLDALYLAVATQGPWSQVLKTLLALGHGGGLQRRALFASALRHVQRALAISQGLGTQVPRAAALDATAASLPRGLLLLDARANVLFASERAHALLGHRSGVQLEDGRLRSLRTLTDRGLASGLTRLFTTTTEPRSAALCVDLSPEGRHGGLRLLLMRSAAEASGPAAVLAIAFEQNQSPAQPTTQLLRELYGFSAAEAELAGLLLSGQSLSEVARTRSVTMNTTKSQLRNVLRKTGSRNQADLLRTLIAGPAGLLQGFGALAGNVPG